MEKNTFGATEKYKALEYINEKILLLERKDKRYIGSFLHEFNENLCDLKRIRNKSYILKLIRNDYKNRCKVLESRFDSKLVSYIRNFICAKFRNLKNN